MKINTLKNENFSDSATGNIENFTGKTREELEKSNPELYKYLVKLDEKHDGNLTKENLIKDLEYGMTLKSGLGTSNDEGKAEELEKNNPELSAYLKKQGGAVKGQLLSDFFSYMNPFSDLKSKNKDAHEMFEEF